MRDFSWNCGVFILQAPHDPDESFFTFLLQNKAKISVHKLETIQSPSSILGSLIIAQCRVGGSVSSI